jgi:hypothetical protein
MSFLLSVDEKAKPGLDFAERNHSTTGATAAHTNFASVGEPARTRKRYTRFRNAIAVQIVIPQRSGGICCSGRLPMSRF